MFRLIEDGKVELFVVDDMCTAGKKERCEQFGRDMNKKVPAKNLGELRLYSGLVYERDRDAGLLGISQETYARNLVERYRVESERHTPLPVGAKQEEYDGWEDLSGEIAFRALVGALMWTACQTRPDIARPLRAVAK